MAVAFGPRPPFTAENCGTIAIGWSDMDVGQILRDGNNVIVVSDSDRLVIYALDGYPPLQRVPVPQ